jgi:hypothetical protein
MKHPERHAPRARAIRLAGLVAGFAACAAAMSGTRVEAWSNGSPMLRAAARYMPHAAGMIAAPALSARAPSDPAPRVAPVVRAARPLTGRRARALSVWNKPMRESWPAERAWTPAVEDDYSRFVTAIGRGIVARRCIHLDDCLNNPAINPLYDSDEMRLGLMPDCADLPYMLRGYFAFKRHLPFGFVAAMGGEGGDPRYLHRGIPVLWRQWTDFRSPRAFFDEMPSYVHSGMFRLSPKIEEADTYAPTISRAAVRPGAMYYDTDGHVLVVAEVFPDGNIQFIDGHPGGSISHPRFDAPRQTPPGAALWGGGFRVWRPQRLVENTIVRTRNGALRDFAPFHQYDRANYVVGGAPVAYDDWVRDALTARP